MYLFVLQGCSMLAVALLAAFLWRQRTHVGWRWFLVGAAIWTAGVTGKLIWSALLNPVLLGTIKGYGGAAAYPFLGAFYLGINSAVWEIGVTAIAARRWRNMTRNPDRAAGVGVGAGAFEAGLLGLVVTISIVLALFDGPSGQEIADSIAQLNETTPIAWLVGPVERVIAILLHVSTRMLVLLAVVHRRRELFWYGFALFAFADGLAGFAIMTEVLTTRSVWWFEFALLPVVVVSLAIIAWCYRHWPTVVDNTVTESALSGISQR
jgi:uncharacterized membrane protein YhfC